MSVKRRRTAAYRRGLHGEVWAAWALRLKGYRILQRRFRSPVGEIDVVAVRGRELVIVEVKCRYTTACGLEAVTPNQQNRLRRAAEFFLSRFPKYVGYDVRFDVMVKRPWRWPVHFQNIF